MSGADIAAQVAAGIAEASATLGDGRPLMAVIVRTVVISDTSTYPVQRRESTTRFELPVIKSRYSLRDRADGVVQPNDIRLMVGVGDIVPKTSDRMELNGRSYELVDIEPFEPGGIPVYYIIRARG